MRKVPNLTLRREDGRVVGCARSPGDPVAQRETAALALARAQLHDLAGSATRRGAERPEVGDDLDHDLVGVEEDDVDREPHERRVDRPRRAEEDALARREVLLPEQAAEPTPGRVGDRHRFRDDAAVFAAQSEVRDLAHDGRC